MNKLLLATLISTFVSVAYAEQTTLTIEAGAPAGKASPTLYGLMTEEINYCYDGGLYAELVRNRAFLDDKEKPLFWSVVPGDGKSATISLDPAQPLNAAIPTSLRLDATSASAATPAGVANAGYWGFPIKPETHYRGTFHAKADAKFRGAVDVALVSEDGATVYAKTRVSKLTPDWKAYEFTLKTAKKITPTAKARLVLTVSEPGTLWFGLVSLFPPTWKDRPNGLRTDLMQMLVDMKPAFLRFPGGNFLEGEPVETRFEWKKTLGPIEQRTGHQGTWGYRASDGMGLLEFLTWTEDMGAEPVLALYAGYSLKGAHVNPGPDLETYLQEALEEIEYVSGPVTSTWGARRAKDGHPAPFKLHYVEIGNEDWFDKSGSYDGRFAQFADAIKAKYPNLKCISSVGTEQSAEKRVQSRKPDVIDEHYYRNTEAFLGDSATHFEGYDRHGPEIFVGEWAAHETSFPPWDKRSKGLPATPTMKAALGDGAFMAAMERNSDLITMQCYAPLFANVNDYQWRPDLIGYNAIQAYGSPSYYAIKMFSRNLGDALLKAHLENTSEDKTKLVHYSVTTDTKRGLIYVKLVNAQNVPEPLTIALKGIQTIAPDATVETLAADPTATNSVEQPTNVIPAVSKISAIKPTFNYSLPPSSITVLTLKTR